MSAALRTVALALLVGGCANAGNPGTGPGDDAPKIDAAVPHDGHQTDTPPPIDAPMIDAPLAADAAADASTMGGFCAGNGDCTTTGECCFAISGAGVCVPGTVIGSGCLPM
jgi:hypothetical protein